MGRAYGYAGEIKLIEWEGADTPAQLQIICVIPWKYGVSAQEFASSYIHVRIQAFVSRAYFATPVCAIAAGGPDRWLLRAN